MVLRNAALDAIEAVLPADLRGLIDVFVLDVSRQNHHQHSPFTKWTLKPQKQGFDVYLKSHYSYVDTKTL
ncbi:TPA: hypothetical protein N2G30_002234 [Salmonella enterica]|nr:hypothetical protein [Salmonella enterica]